MPRNIKRIAHDLTPLADAITELSLIISELLNNIKPHAQFSNLKASESFGDCTKACQKLALSAKLVREYVQKVNDEADEAGITKD